MRLKKFNELYDTDELKSSHEIEQLQGLDLKKISSHIMISDKSPINKILKRLCFEIPLLSKCLDNNLGNFKAIESPKGYYNFYVKSDSKYLQYAISINKDNDYFIAFLIRDLVTDKQEFSHTYNNLTENQLIEVTNKIIYKILDFLKIKYKKNIRLN